MDTLEWALPPTPAGNRLIMNIRRIAIWMAGLFACLSILALALALIPYSGPPGHQWMMVDPSGVLFIVAIIWFLIIILTRQADRRWGGGNKKSN
jgi:uncharacterized RDD family membrane protein YckC